MSGRTAIVTGAASGLGFAIARGLATAGAHVVIADVNQRALSDAADALAAEGFRSVAMAVDVTRRQHVQRMVATVTAELGTIDVLVNSAGISIWKPALELSVKTFRRVVEVNMMGTFNCCQAVGRLMVERGSGAIVNLASTAGLVGYAGNAAYCASKGGVVQLTRALAVEWASSGVRINAVAPSTFDTPLVRKNAATDAERYHQLVGQVPLGRMGHPHEIVGPVLFLASDASSMVTGHILAVDGGYLAK